MILTSIRWKVNWIIWSSGTFICHVQLLFLAYLSGNPLVEKTPAFPSSLVKHLSKRKPEYQLYEIDIEFVF